MSTSKTKIFQNRPPVIVMAYRGEPVQVRAIRIRGDLIEVYRVKEDVTINLPRHSLFRYDESLYNELREAFVSEDTHRLKELWATASSFQGDESEGASDEPGRV
jgi:hypothetical protein